MPPRARICVAPAFFMPYSVVGCILPVFLLEGAVQMMFFTPAALAVAAVMAAVAV